MTMDELIAKLKALVGKRAGFDNEEFNAMDASGGNYDDAYDMGCKDGEIALAREILPMVELVRHNLEMARMTEAKP
jgi:hypothetical protein